MAKVRIIFDLRTYIIVFETEQANNKPTMKQMMVM
jgi:hypothetical protein